MTAGDRSDIEAFIARNDDAGQAGGSGTVIPGDASSPGVPDVRRFPLKGEHFARGVVLCLVSAGQSFEFRVLDQGAAEYEIAVAPAAVRYLPAGCFPLSPSRED